MPIDDDREIEFYDRDEAGLDLAVGLIVGTASSGSACSMTVLRAVDAAAEYAEHRFRKLLAEDSGTEEVLGDS